MLAYVGYLRIYPEKFGDAIVRIRDDLMDSRAHHSYIEPLPEGPETICSTPCDAGLFAQADLAEVFNYLRAGKGLNLPNCYRKVMPKLLPYP